MQWAVLWGALAAAAMRLLVWPHYHAWREVAIIAGAAGLLFWQASRWRFRWRRDQ